jgi:hypothetical protein
VNALARSGQHEQKNVYRAGLCFTQVLSAALSPVEISKRLRESMGRVCIELPEKTGTFVS